MVNKVEHNVIVEQNKIRAKSAANDANVAKNNNPIFNGEHQSTAPSSTSAPTEAQTKASEQSKAARAKSQQEAVEDKNLQALINKILQEQGKDSTSENILQIANTLKEDLIAKQSTQELTPEELSQLSAIDRLIKSITGEKQENQNQDVDDQTTDIEKIIKDKLIQAGGEVSQERIADEAETMKMGLLIKQEDVGLTHEEEMMLSSLEQFLNRQNGVKANVTADDKKTPTTPETNANTSNVEMIEKFLVGDLKPEDFNNYIFEYVKTQHKDFDNLTKDEQNKILLNLQKNIVKLSTNSNKSDFSKMTVEEIRMALETVMYCKTTNTSIDEFSKLSPKERISKIDQFEVDLVKNVISKYSPSDSEIVGNIEFILFRSEEKLNVYLERFLSAKNPDYKNMDEKSKSLAKKNFIDNIVQKQLGIKNWKNDSERESKITEFAKDLDVALNKDIPLSKALSMPIKEKIKLRTDVARQNHYQVDSSDFVLQAAIDELEAAGKELTPQNIKSQILKMQESKKIEKDQASEALTAIETTQQLANISNATPMQLKEARKFEALLASSNANEIIETAIEKKDFNTLKSAAAYYALKGNFETYERIIKDPKYGLTDKEIKQCLSVNSHIAAHSRARHMVRGDLKGYQADEKMLQATGNFEVAENSNRILGKFFDGKNYDDAATNSINVWGAKIVPSITEGLNDRSIMNSDDALSHSHNILTSDINKECKSLFTTSIIKTANSPQEQINYAQDFSTINDAAVTEGLAAAEKFVDASVKSQYSSYVDSAIKNNGYSQAEIDNINTARETGKTSYERNVESQTTTSAQAKSETKTSTQQKTQSQTNVTNPSTAKTSSNNATVKLSAANTNSGQQMQQTLLKLQYDSAVAQKEKAMQDLQNIIDKIQNDQEVRAQKQAELAEKAASTDEEIAAAIKEADTKSADIQKNDETKVAQESKESVGVLNEIVETTKVEEVAKKFNISVDDVVTLREAHRQGDLNTIYTKLGSISADAQKKFIQFLSRKDTATIIGFIRNRTTDKSLIKELCRLNPNLIKSLDPDLLLDCGIAKADIIKYAGASQLASMLASQARLGHTDVLNQFYEALGYSMDVASNKSAPAKGGDDFYSYYNVQNGSNKVSMRHYITNHKPVRFWV